MDGVNFEELDMRSYVGYQSWTLLDIERHFEMFQKVVWDADRHC